MSQACFFLTYYHYKIGYEWKNEQFMKRRKSRNILQYAFCIALRYEFLVYCDTPITCYLQAPYKNVQLREQGRDLTQSYDKTPFISTAHTTLL